MEQERITNLKEQTERMSLTMVNLKESFQALCDISLELSKELRSLQQSMDDYETLSMERNERR